MGEYAKYSGKDIKIGTCEDLYYLRYDQRHAVTRINGNLNPTSAADLKVIRFRFPWPHEDKIQPGAFDDPFYGLRIDGVRSPDDIEHYNIQFSHPNGYLVSLPCPEGSKRIEGVNIGKNGYGGAVKLVQQAVRNGKLVPVFQCGGCQVAWRIEDEAELEKYIANVKDKEIANRMKIKEVK